MKRSLLAAAASAAVASATEAACKVCHRLPKTVNTVFGQCSHVDCPHRPRAWSDGIPPAQRQPKRRDGVEALFDKVED